MSTIWMPLYVGDYLRDTRRLTTLQHGAYLLLIMEYWVSGSLPTDDEGLAQVAGLSAAEWAKNKSAIARFFKPNWKHKRIEDERAKAQAKAQAARGSAQKRWDSKRNANAYERDVPLECSSESQSSSPSSPEESSVGRGVEASPREANPGTVVSFVAGGRQ